jgi:2-dehydropantoate 2-reductase
MRIAIMGSGAIGGYFGARLAEAGEDITFIARGAHLEAMQHHGLRVTSPIGDINLSRVKATETPSEIGVVDIVVFAVKLYDSEKAAQAIVPLIGPGTRIVTLQNGIDSVGILAAHVPRSQIVGGSAYISAYVEEPGRIVHGGELAQFKVGGRAEAGIDALREACNRANGINLDVVDDIGQVIWMKFVTLCAFSGATCLMRSGIGPILDDPESRLFTEQLRDEGMAVAAAAGYPMPAGFKDNLLVLWQKFPPGTRSSMANDLERGKPLELKWLSGRIHALGGELGVATPAHSAVYRSLHLHAAGGG